MREEIGCCSRNDEFKYKSSKIIYRNFKKVINEDEAVMNNEKSNNNASYGSYNQTTTLNQYGADLTKQAKEGKLDPVIGRKKR